MSEVVIKADHLRKTFRDYKRNIQKMQHMLLLRRTGEINNVFRDVSFEICKGEKVAIITRPGCGKSTILRLLAGVLTPEKGSVTVNGNLTAILDYKYGFENSLTIEDNYEMKCSLLKWPRNVVKEREAEILKFAGFYKMKDQPLKTVKSLGANRLGFAITTYEKPEILIFDEKFVFGGKAYATKFMNHLKELIDDPEVTFVMSVFKVKEAAQFCTRGIVINDGVVEFDGSFKDAAAYYREHLGASTSRKKKSEREEALEEASVEAVEEAEDSDDDDGMD